MIKARTFAAAAVIAVAPLMLSAAQAFASTSDTPGASVSATGSAAATDSGTGPAAGTFFDQTQTLAGQQATFIQGGDDLGRGAAELVSSAYIGGPQGILDIPAHVLGIPKPLLYLP
jgi:hypothetical protein